MSPSSPRARTDYLFSSPRVLGRLPSMGFSELQLKTMILPAASKQFGTGELVRDAQDVEAGAMATGNAAEVSVERCHCREPQFSRLKLNAFALGLISEMFIGSALYDCWVSCPLTHGDVGIQT
ncbi:hypothetical protein PUNSTDRAFT_130502 [Punctularia strigosozonata HHB-11173 SS5]|uniref:uncharacterized protein n=1 Tax=Punctularia strigosozonata (strain HHB-11173) TaxID=741275 RepID=UPI0004417B26|nr:uncharacterized protein PUNSTDRAFT_130502 [Punctularia strigosozonata HHB-11173 SS5]EIN12233.1 hypothetical protein PUNSTDRAFT_130502 [Punctularia strigosozonata HHB-11173 SS5]